MDSDTRRALARTVGPLGLSPSFVVADDGSQYNLAIGSAATERYQVVWYGEPIATMTSSPVGQVPGTIGDLVTIVNVILSGDESAMVKRCLMADVDLDYVIRVNELILAINRSLGIGSIAT